MGFITRVGQGFSGINSAQVVVPVSASTIGNGSLLVAVGHGVSSGSITVASITDTQGNIYTHLYTAAPTGTFRNAELWACTGFTPLKVQDSSGLGDSIIITLTAAESRGVAAIIDQFTALGTPDGLTSYTTTALQNSFKLAGTISTADVLSYIIAMPDFTVTWINPPAIGVQGQAGPVGYQVTGDPVTPAGGSSLQTACLTSSQLGTGLLPTGPITADWSWGPEGHAFAVIMANFPPAVSLTDVAAASDDDGLVVTVNQVVGGVPAPAQPQVAFSSLSASTFAQIVSSYAMPVTALATYNWACWGWQAFATDTPLFIQINWLDASKNFISASGSSGVASTVPVLFTVSGAAPSTAVFAQADIFNFGSPPSPSHAYYATAAPQTSANWISVPGLNAWQTVTLGGGGSLNSVIAAQSDWVPAFGPQNDFGACVDMISVLQEGIQ